MQRMRWRNEEVDKLIEGCSIYGPGKWAHILDYGDEVFAERGRSTVDLKDKFRNLVKSGHPKAIELHKEYQMAKMEGKEEQVEEGGGSGEGEQAQEEEEEEEEEQAQFEEEEQAEEEGKDSKNKKQKKH